MLTGLPFLLVFIALISTWYCLHNNILLQIKFEVIKDNKRRLHFIHNLRARDIVIQRQRFDSLKLDRFILIIYFDLLIAPYSPPKRAM